MNFYQSSVQKISFQSQQQNPKFLVSKMSKFAKKTKYFYTRETHCPSATSLFVTATKLNIFIPVNFLQSQFNMSCLKNQPETAIKSLCPFNKSYLSTFLCYFILLIQQWKKMLNQSRLLESPTLFLASCIPLQYFLWI